MTQWLATRVFIAFFLTLFGLHMLFGNDTQALIGAALSGIGLTFLFWAWVEVKKSGR